MDTFPIETIIHHFGDLPDPRIERGKQHNLLDIVAIAICAVLCNADNWVEIEAYGRVKESWLHTFLSLPNGIPSHDTFNRVFARLNPTVFQERFLQWIKSISTCLPGDVIAIDGKTSRSTRDTALHQSPLHIVSAWSTNLHLVLGQVRVDTKSNEITAIPALLDVLDIENCIITIDAMGCQTAIADAIIERKGSYVLACKDNHEHLAADVRAIFAPVLDGINTDVRFDYHKTVDYGHGRCEIREYWSTDMIDTMRNKERWRAFTSVAAVRSERRTAQGTTIETRYYISSEASNASLLGHAIRSHWGIENNVHWLLDVVFRDDASRSRRDHAAHNLSIIRHIALNMLRQETSLKASIRGKRLRAGWDNTYLLKILQMGTKIHNEK